MRLIAAKEAHEGMVIGKSIYDYNNKLMLGAGFRLTSDVKSKLLEKKYTYIYILEEGTEDIIPEDIISDQVKMMAKLKMTEKADQIQNYFKFRDMTTQKVYDLLKNGYLKHVNISFDMKTVVEEIFKDISVTGAKFMNTLLLKSKETYSMDHAINTTLTALLIGKTFGFNKAELLDLGLGCFLHDFGKQVIEKIRENNEKLAESLLKEHPTFGYLIVKNSQNSSPIVSQIVNQHHERQDGKGYPIGLKGQNLPPLSNINRETRGMIFRLAEICTVADAYDNMLMNPIKEKQLSPSDAIKEIIIGAESAYNKHVVQALVKITPLYPVGTYIKITNFFDPTLIGFRGVVAKINEQRLDRPVIILLHDSKMRRITPQAIDTAKFKHIGLELIL